jgi:hypothetical protein
VAAITVLTVIVTWPLTPQLTRSLPGDYGDPVFVTWVISWVNGRLSTAAFDGFWTANIFFPERNTLAFSEHFVAQSVMVLPVSVLSGNPILSYNVAFLSTFVLTGLGMFLLTRALTGSDVAGFAAALMTAFNEYRLVYEVAHLHTLSIGWFPFVLYCLHRYFVTDKRRYLAGAAATSIALNLSSIYYMAYCAPFVLAFACFEGWRQKRLSALRTWLELWATAALVVVVTAPFLLPYLAVQQRLGVVRSAEEVARFSATLDHYRIALPALVPALCLGLVAVVLAPFDGRTRWVTPFSLALLALAFWLSLGLIPQAGGAPLGWPGLYAVFHNYVPGFSGLRVPARFAMLFFVFLSLAAACGVAAVERRWLRVGRVIASIAVAIFVVQASPAAFPLNQVLPSQGLVSPPPAYLTPAPTLPQVYRALETVRADAVIAELPFGDSWYDLRYMYFAGIHRRRLMNGYSGLFPPSYLARQRVLAQPLLDPPASAQALNGATHIIIHRRAWSDDTGTRLAAWLEQYGAQSVVDVDGAVLYELPVRESLAELTPPTPLASFAPPTLAGKCLGASAGSCRSGCEPRRRTSSKLEVNHCPPCKRRSLM